MPQTFFRIIFSVMFLATISACEKVETLSELNEVEFQDNRKENNTSSVLTRNLVIECPLQIDQYDEVQSQKSYPLTVVGLCPNDGNFPSELTFKTNISGVLSQSSSFSVIDAKNYDTIDLSHFFKLDIESNNFILVWEKANEMWDSLEKGSYEFSANIITEDFEAAESYSFQFQIK